MKYANDADTNETVLYGVSTTEENAKFHFFSLVCAFFFCSSVITSCFCSLYDCKKKKGCFFFYYSHCYFQGLHELPRDSTVTEQQQQLLCLVKVDIGFYMQMLGTYASHF